VFLSLQCYCEKPPDWYTGTLEFPFTEKDCYHKGSSTVLTSWFYLKREDVKGYYSALNIPAKQGSIVYSICEGDVTNTYYSPITGVSVVVTTPKGLNIIYGHLSDWKVLKGMHVYPKTPIGIVGRSGRTTGRHLYLASEYKGQRQCISPYFNRKWYCIGNGEIRGIEYE
jgi:murein DD-endopeptidase MepM/ murein hydrolase activator NlpD